MSPEKREELIEAYCNYQVDSLDLETLTQMVYDQMEEGLKNESDADLLVLISNHYPNLLDDDVEKKS